MDPALKYTDKVDPKHKMAMDAIGFAFQMLDTQADHFDQFLEAERRSHTVGHIVDPTLYRDQINSESFALQVRAAEAAQAFIREMRAIQFAVKNYKPSQ